jgi:hypothetical protein
VVTDIIRKFKKSEQRGCLKAVVTSEVLKKVLSQLLGIGSDSPSQPVNCVIAYTDDIEMDHAFNEVKFNTI